MSKIGFTVTIGREDKDDHGHKMRPTTVVARTHEQVKEILHRIADNLSHSVTVTIRYGIPILEEDE